VIFFSFYLFINVFSESYTLIYLTLLEFNFKTYLSIIGSFQIPKL